MYRSRGSLCALIALVAAIGGCTPSDTRNISQTIGPGNTSGVPGKTPGATPLLLTTADLRIVTERPDPKTLNHTIVCAEPPPDVAKALSTAAEIAAKVGVPSGANGSGSISSATAEQLAELGGRVPGLLALRDGLFRACEAYANGMIGDSAYSLILSRYGDYLTTLILGDAVPDSGAKPAVLNGVTLTVPAVSADGGSGTTPGAKTAASLPARDAPQNTAVPPAASPGVQVASLEPIFVSQADPARTPAAGAGTGDAAGRPATAPTTTPATKVAPAPAIAKATPSASAPASTYSDAQALEAMQYNALHLSPIGPLLVACLSEWDPTRQSVAPYENGQERHNVVLTLSFCQDLLVRIVTMTELTARSEADIRKIKAQALLAAAQKGGK